MTLIDDKKEYKFEVEFNEEKLWHRIIWAIRIIFKIKTKVSVKMRRTAEYEYNNM